MPYVTRGGQRVRHTKEFQTPEEREPYLPPEHPLRQAFERMEQLMWAQIRRQEAVSRETEG